jgi:hypothetical protein
MTDGHKDLVHGDGLVWVVGLGGLDFVSFFWILLV